MIPAIVAGGIAAANLIGNAIQASNDADRRSEARARLRGQKAALDSDYASVLEDIGKYYTDRGGLGTADDVTSYRTLVTGYNPDDFVYSPDKTFDETYSKTRDDFINPYMQKIIGDAAQQVQHTAAGAGVGRGSGAVEAIAAEVAQKSNDLYREAQQEYKDDRNFEYNKYNDYIAQKQRELDTKRQALDSKINLTGNLAQDYFSVMDAEQADKLKLGQDRRAAQVTYDSAMAGLY